MKTKVKLGMAVVLAGCLWHGGAVAQVSNAPAGATTAAAARPTRTLGGRAVDTDGKPVSGARIMVRGGPTNVYSGGDGRFQITWRPPATVRAVPRLLAREPLLNLVGFAEIGENSEVQVMMEPGLTMVVPLKDPEGRAVTNGYAFFGVDPGFGDGEWVLDNHTMADEEGRLVDTALPRRSRVRVAIDAPQLGREELSANPEETDVSKFEFPPLKMRRGNLKLNGKVLDAGGDPAPGVRVSLAPTGGQASDSTTTDEKGAFKFEHVLPGSVFVTVSGPGGRGSGSGRGGDSAEMVIRLGSSGGSSSAITTITGMVLNTNGTPAEGVLVMTIPGMPSPPGRPEPVVKTDAQGAFSIQWRPPGVGSPSLIARDPARNLAAVQQINSGTTRQNLQLRPGLTIRGKVVDAAGKPLPGAILRQAARLSMWNGTVERDNIPLNERGEFQMSGLPTDAYYHFTAQIPGRALDEKTLMEAQTRVSFIQLEPLVLKLLDHPLAGMVLDADGKPVPGAEIRIANQHQGSSSVYTDSHGHFQTVASEDRTRVTAVLNGKGSVADIQVTGGDTNVLIQFPGAAKPGGASSGPTNTPGITVAIRCLTNVFKLGDEIPVEFIITSQRTNDYNYVEYADDSERPGQYKLIATTPSGEKVPDPRKDTPISEEASRRSPRSGVLRPGESFTRLVLLNRWSRIREPGSYQIAGICSNRYNPTINGNSDPISLTVLPRSEEEMADYISALDHQVAERLALQAGKTAKTYDARLHELAVKLMFTGRPEIVPTLFRILEESGHEGNCFHEALAFNVPHTESIRRALVAETAKDIPDVNIQNWLWFTLRNYGPADGTSASNVAVATRGMLEPAGNSLGISLEVRCTNQVLKAGDEVPIEFIVSNLGTADYKFEDRTYDRSGRMEEYQLKAKAGDGSFLADPREKFQVGMGGGLFQYGVLHPGESFSKVIPLNRWALVKDSGTYEVTGTYHARGAAPGSSGEAVTSEPIPISVVPRAAQEMEVYINELAKQLGVAVARRGTNTQFAPSADLDELVKKLMYTCSPDAVPPLLETMYEPNQGFWQAEALLYYIPRSEKIGKAIGEAAARRGLASNMQYLIRQYGEGTTENEMRQYISRSLAVDSPRTWAEGALAAQQHPDDAFTPRLIALATEPKGTARMQAIYALAMNRTDAGVKTLKQLLNDPEKQIYDTVERAIRMAYTSRGNSTGRLLKPDDFDAQYQRPNVP